MLDPSARDSSENNVPSSGRKVMPPYPVPTSGRTPVAAVVEAAAAARKGTREGAKEGRKKGKEGFWWKRKVGKI